MRSNQGNLFSQQRFGLFTGNSQNISPNTYLHANYKNQQSQVITPSDKNQQNQMLIMIIQKKDLQIRELKKKLRNYEINLNQTKKKLESTNYELQYFKRKISQQIQKSKQFEARSKQYQSQAHEMNKKVIDMIKRLDCAKKLKNPIEFKQENINWQQANKIIQNTKINQTHNQNKKSNKNMNLYCIQHLNKIISFKLKKVKSQKNLLDNHNQIIPNTL